MIKPVPNPIDCHVGSRVRIQRMLVGVTQEKLGGALGITFQQIQKYEKGSNRISASRLQQIANMLNVPVASFFEGAPTGEAAAQSSDQPSNISQASAFMVSAEGVKLTKALLRIKSASVRRRVIELVETLGEGECASWVEATQSYP